MRECPECGIVLDEDEWAAGESCPVCNPYEGPEYEAPEEHLIEGDGFSDDTIWGYKDEEYSDQGDEDLKLLGGIFGAAIDE